MIRVEFLGPIKKEPIEVNISNLNQLSDILKQDSEMISWLENSAVAVNDILISDKNYNIKDGDKISLLPPVCGG
jgi:molybdopterin synthase sulfur carrier subunit